VSKLGDIAWVWSVVMLAISKLCVI